MKAMQSQSSKLDRHAAVNVLITSAAAGVLRLLPYEDVSGYPVPTVIFKGSPTTFRVLVWCLLLGFITSFISLFLVRDNKPNMVARICRSSSAFFVAAASSILALSALCCIVFP